MGYLERKNTAMENICEFCMALRPIVYCKSDAARLCLSCDAKVHSANALSNRHPRTLVCEACRRRPVYVQCFNHEMFLCRSCDNSHHASSQHQKKVVRSYVGCPSALDLAALWGFELNELENKSSFKDRYVFASVITDSGVLISNTPAQSCSQNQGSSLVSEIDHVVSVLCAASEEGSCSQQTEVFGLMPRTKRWTSLIDFKPSLFMGLHSKFLAIEICYQYFVVCFFDYVLCVSR